MPNEPQGQKRLAVVIDNAVHVMRQHMRHFTRLTAAGPSDRRWDVGVVVRLIETTENQESVKL